MIWIITTAALLIPMFFLLAGLAITVWSDPYISRKHRMILLAIVALSVSLIAQNLLEDHIAAESPQWFWRTTLAIYGYTVRPVLLILFLYIIQPEKKHLPAWGLAAVNWAIYMTAYYSHLCFWISSGNQFYRGPLAYTCFCVSVILEAMGMRRDIRVDFIEEPRIGEYVIVHAGFAIERLPEQQAREDLEAWEELKDVLV